MRAPEVRASGADLNDRTTAPMAQALDDVALALPTNEKLQSGTFDAQAGEGLIRRAVKMPRPPMEDADVAVARQLGQPPKFHLIVEA